MGFFSFGSKKDKPKTGGRSPAATKRAAERKQLIADKRKKEAAAGAKRVKKMAAARAAQAAKGRNKPKPKVSTGNFKAQDRKPVGAGVNLKKTAEAAKKLDSNQRVTTSENRKKTAAVKATTNVPKPPPKAKSNQAAPKRPTWKDYKSAAAAKKAGFANYIGRDGKKKAAVFKTDLKKGQTLTQYLNEKRRAAKGVPKPKTKIKKTY
jgi:hypothetical protein